MPIYQYKCDQCGETEDKLVKIGDVKDLLTCGKCGKETAKRVVVNRTGMLLVGTGYYQSDFKNGNNGRKQ